MNNFDVEALKKALVDRTRDASRDRLGKNLKPKKCLILKTQCFSPTYVRVKTSQYQIVYYPDSLCYPSSIVSHGDLDILKEHTVWNAGLFTLYQLFVYINVSCLLTLKCNLLVDIFC